jgi:hypothetical protein
VTRRSLFAALPAAAGFALPERRIVVRLDGGLSHTDTLDLRVGPWTPRWFDPVQRGGVQFPRGLMPGLAGWLDHAAFIRGVRASTTNHEFAREGSTADYRLDGWDHHAAIYEPDALLASCRKLDRLVCSLLDSADHRTVVVVESEFGRTGGPLTAKGGRDHDLTHAVAMFGRGISGPLVRTEPDRAG